MWQISPLKTEKASKEAPKNRLMIEKFFRRNSLCREEICEASPIPEVHPLSFYRSYLTYTIRQSGGSRR